MHTSALAVDRRNVTLVLLAGSKQACPKGCSNVLRTEQVPSGSYFVRYDPVQHERWEYKLSERPWHVALMGEAGKSNHNSSFSSIEKAVRKAQMLQRRMAS